MKPVLPLYALIPVALGASAVLFSPAGAQPAPATATPASNVTVSRADVERDLAAWKASGLEEQWNREETPNFYTEAYVTDYTKYEDTVRPGGMARPPSQSQTPSESQRRW